MSQESLMTATRGLEAAQRAIVTATMTDRVNATMLSMVAPLTAEIVRLPESERDKAVKYLQGLIIGSAKAAGALLADEVADARLESGAVV